MHIITLQINDKCGPMARGELYREPLEEFFEENNLGEVTGGGTLLGHNGQPEYSELDISIKDSSDNVITKLIDKINNIVPKGSTLFLEDDKEVKVGLLEGVAVNLNHSLAPNELLDKMDFQAMWEDFENAIGDDGKMHDDWDGEDTFTIYYYGISAQKIMDNMNEELNKHKIKDYIELEVQPIVLNS
jgi:hypothetical protein